jgi:hypothetical protein
MASQEHLAMLHDDVSTSTSSTGSGDDDDDGDDETSSESGEIPTASMEVAANDNGNGNGNPNDNANDDDDSDSSSENMTSSKPAEKRIKLSLSLLKTAPQAPTNYDDDDDDDDDEKDEQASLASPKKDPSTSTSPPKAIVSMSIPERSLPPKKKVKLHMAPNANANANDAADDNDNDVKAMVVDSDDAGEDDAVAAVVEEAAPPATKKPTDVTSSSSTTPKPPRKPANPALRPVRLPPMSSPGLLIPPVSGVFRGAADTNGNTTPASVFDHAMGLAGYTTEGRIKRPHRGSSVQRVVSDMFDSNVKFALHFPKLIPKDLLPTKKQGEDDYDGDGNSIMNGDHQPGLPERLMKAFRVKRSYPPPARTSNGNGNGDDHNHSTNKNGRIPKAKRRKLATFRDMIPVSLAIPYPEEFIQKRLEYVEQINER